VAKYFGYVKKVPVPRNVKKVPVPGKNVKKVPVPVPLQKTLKMSRLRLPGSYPINCKMQNEKCKMQNAKWPKIQEKTIRNHFAFFILHFFVF